MMGERGKERKEVRRDLVIGGEGEGKDRYSTDGKYYFTNIKVNLASSNIIEVQLGKIKSNLALLKNLI